MAIAVVDYDDDEDYVSVSSYHVMSMQDETLRTMQDGEWRCGNTRFGCVVVRWNMTARSAAEFDTAVVGAVGWMVS